MILGEDFKKLIDKKMEEKAPLNQVELNRMTNNIIANATEKKVLLKQI